MRKILTAAFVACICFSMDAAMGENVSFGLRAGGLFGGFRSSDDQKLFDNTSLDWEYSNSTKLSYSVGAVVDIPVVKKWNLSLQSGVWFMEKRSSINAESSYYTNGSDWGYSGSYVTTSRKGLSFSAMFLQVPVLITYHYNFGPVRAELNVGPYVEYRVGKGDLGIESGTEVSGSFNGKDVSKEYDPDVLHLNFASDDDKAFGYGISFGAGAYFHKVYLGFKYDLGLNDYYSERNTDVTLKANVCSVCVGYNF